ncbi:arylamine N-acetyltransferase [Novosphingobium sp.]|uniref:arylamine N-acetyltransferase family protein n=1 Tax=Novosphingobium sp. TaxID=1874826 RepID=UPI0035AFA503
MIDPLSPAQLDAYFARIGYAGRTAADLETLTALHRAHVLAIPFENLDVQLGTPPGLEQESIFAKLVEARRGGWCYEHNGLLGRALAALGFSVMRLSGGVLRELRGEQSMGSHLCLKVTLDGAPYLVDVGFGSTQIEPLPLAEQTWAAEPMTGRILRTQDGLWGFAIETGPTPISYDFPDAPADEGLLAEKCEWQGRDGESPFVQNLIVQQRTPDGHLMLRGKVLTETGPDGSATRELTSQEELVGVLRHVFALDVPEAARLWSAIEERHAALFS